MKPIIENALSQGNKGDWPVLVRYLDIKNDPLEHIQVMAKVLDKEEAWLTTDVKSGDIKGQSPFDLKPLMVLVEDKQNDIKQKFFHDDIPVGGKIRAFGTITKFDENPNKLPHERRSETPAMLATIPV